MNNEKIQSELYSLIDSSEEVFREYCRTQNVGFLLSLRNLLLMTYNEVSKIKTDLVDAISTGKVSNNESTTRVLNGLYSKLLRVEHRSFLLKELIDEKTL